MSKRDINTPARGDFMINPLTNRPIKVGGATWKKLVRSNIIDGHYVDPTYIEKQREPEFVAEQINEINKTLPRGQQAVRGRGKYKNTIVKRNLQPSEAEIAKASIEASVRVVSENLDDLANLDGDDLEDVLDRLILAELANTGPKRPVGRPRKAHAQSNVKFTVLKPVKEESSEEESSEDESSEEESEDEGDFE